MLARTTQNELNNKKAIKTPTYVVIKAGLYRETRVESRAEEKLSPLIVPLIRCSRNVKITYPAS